MENSLELQYRFFVVDEKPYCLWDTDIKERTIKFLESVDPTYFMHVADTHFESLAEANSQQCALVIRSTYAQSLETLFALIGAAVQSPYCVPGWILKYGSHDLRSVVKKIQDHQPLLSHLQRKNLSWAIIAEALLAWLALEDKNKECSIKTSFAKLWSRLASDFLDETSIHEYNSIKHGLRLRAGGFSLALGREETPGVPAPAENMRLWAKSEYGSSFLVSEKFGQMKHHIHFVHHAHNWNPEDLVWGIHLVSISISNVLSALKILNGIPSERVRFEWPNDLASFDEPWRRAITLGTRAMSFQPTVIPEELITPFSKEEILSRYQNGEDGGIQRIVVRNASGADDEIREKSVG